MEDAEGAAGFFIVLLMILCIFGMITHVADIESSYQASWESTTGTISIHEIYEFSDGDEFAIEITYTYTVDNRVYSNNQVLSERYNNSDQATINMEQKYPPGMEIQVYYSPHLPTWSEYDPGERSEPDTTINTWLIIGIILAGSLCTYILGSIEMSYYFPMIILWNRIRSTRKGGLQNKEDLIPLASEVDDFKKHYEKINTTIPRVSRIERLQENFDITSDLTSTYLLMAVVIAITALSIAIFRNDRFAQLAVIFGMPPIAHFIQSVWWQVVLAIIITYLIVFLIRPYKQNILDNVKEIKLRDLFNPGLIAAGFIGGFLIGGGLVVTFLMGILLIGLIAWIIFGTIGAVSYIIYFMLKPITYWLLPHNVIYQQGLPLFISQVFAILVIVTLTITYTTSSHELNRFNVAATQADQLMLPESGEILATSSSERYITFSYYKGKVYVLDRKNEEIIKFKPQSSISSLVINENYLIGCSDQGTIHTWDLETHTMTTTTTELKEMTTARIVDQQLLLADQKGHLVIINLKTEEFEIEMDLQAQAIVALQTINNSAYILDITGKLVELDRVSLKIKREEDLSPANCMAISDNSASGSNSRPQLYLGNRKEGIASYDLQTMKYQDEFSTASSVRSLIMVDTYLIAGLADGQLQLFDLSNQNQTSLVRIHLYSVDFLDYVAPYLITASNDGTIKTFDLYQSLLAGIQRYNPRSDKIVPQQWISQRQAKELVYCYICMTYTTPEDKIVRCPSCRAAFHQKEISQWFRSKPICPICRDEVAKDISYE